ncbi:MAG: hypothetical protein FJ149_10220 [Euryarchaeota archaeon]|nr:hypothetical protein [Euryarchaeota archaeon]
MSLARVLAILVPLLLLFDAPAPAEPERPASISIALEATGMDVVWNASGRWYEFNGTLSLDDPLQLDIDVSLFTMPPPGWSAACKPEVHYFRGSGERPFTCSFKMADSTVNMTGNITVQGLAYRRGDVVASNTSPPFTVRVTRLPVEKYFNLTNPHKIDYTTRLEDILPHLGALAAIVTAVAAAAVAWRRRRRRMTGRGAGP